MKVQSTGLGKTVMLAHFKELLNTEYDNRQVLQLTMESTEPLHWTIKVYMEPADLRTAIAMGLKPSVLWKAFLAVARGQFSLFKKPPAATPQPSAEFKPSPVESSVDSAEAKSGTSAVSRSDLKESEDGDKPVSPLSKLKG